MATYHFRLPDGQEQGWEGTPAALRKAHPGAVIIGRVEVDEVGQGRLVAYQGEQPVEKAAAQQEVAGPIDAPADEPAKPAARAAKKAGS